MRVYVDMDGVLCDYEKAWSAEYNEDYNRHPQSRVGFFRDLKPLPGAIEGFKALVGAGHDVYILTAPSIKNPHSWSEKAEWIEEYLGYEWLKKLILTRHKELLCDGKAILIDDLNSGKSGQGVWDTAGKLVWLHGSIGWPQIVHALVK